MTGHDQGKINGRLIAAGRVVWQQYGEEEDQSGYVFLKNNGFVLKVDQKMMESLGVTMEAMTDCVKQLDEMGDIKVRDAIRQNSGPTHSGLVITSKVDPRICMVVSMEDSNQDETDLGLAWFLDHENLKNNMGNTSEPEVVLVAQELDALTQAREVAKMQAQEMEESLDEFGIPILKESNDRYSLKELKNMDTLAVGQTSDLKIDDGSTRVWLARTGVEDGEPYDNKVTVEKLRGGRWVTVDEYQAESVESVSKTISEAKSVSKKVHKKKIEETGEADQDYDKELYDAIASFIKKKTGMEASHREFDKYHGVVITVSKKGKTCCRLWTVDSYFIGKVKKDNAKYLSAELISDGERVSYDEGDYFMLKPEEKVGDVLRLTKIDGKTITIRNPKKKDLPKFGEVRTTIHYEGDPSDVVQLWPEDEDKDLRLEVMVSPDRKRVHADELIAFLNQKKSMMGESIEDLLGIEPLSESVPQMRDILRTGILLESSEEVKEVVSEDRGSGWGDLKPSARISSVHEVNVGDIILNKSLRFKSKNVIRVTMKMDDKIKGIFVDPSDTSKKRLPDDREFVIWDFDLTDDSNEYYKSSGDKKEIGDEEMSDSKKDFESICEEVDMFGVPKFLNESEHTHMKAGSALARPVKKQGTEYGEKDAGKPRYCMTPAQKDSAVKSGASKLGGDKDGVSGHVSAKTKLEKEGMIPKASPDRGEAKLSDGKIKVGNAKDGVGDHVKGDAGTSDNHQKPVAKQQVKPGRPNQEPKVMAETREARMERIKSIYRKKIEEMKSKKMAQRGHKGESKGKMLPAGHKALKKKVVESDHKPTKFQNIDSREQFAMIKEAIKPPKGMAAHGFDLTEIDAEDFKSVLDMVGASHEAKLVGDSLKYWEFRGPGILIATANNPITGLFAREVGYASYIGIEGEPKKVAYAVSAIKQKAKYIKGESPGYRRFI